MQEAIRLLFNRFGIIQADVSFKILAQIIRNVISYPENEKFRTINTKSEAFQRNVGRLVGGTAILKLSGFQEDENGSLVLLQPNKSILEASLLHLDNFLHTPVTDVVDRLSTIVQRFGNDLAFYAGQELLATVRRINGQPNSVTKRFDFSGAYKARLGPFANLTELLFTVLKFVEADDHKCAKRESFFAPEEMEYLRLLERDLNKWVQTAQFETPIAIILKTYLKENIKQIVVKFVNFFIGAIQNIILQPENTLFQKIKLDILLNKIGGNIAHGERLFQSFAFDIKPDGTAQLRTPFDVHLLQAKFEDLKLNWEQCQVL